LVNNDIYLDQTGNPILIADEDKLVQDFSNIIRIPLGFHFAHPELGTRINSLIGQPYSQEGIKGLVENELNNAVQQLSSLQYLQSKYQSISYAESIDSVKNLEIYEYTMFSISFTCELYAKSGEERRINETL